MKEGNFCCHKTTERSEKEYKSLMNRLSRIEGQIRGIKGMVERNVYCTDILIQDSIHLTRSFWQSTYATAWYEISVRARMRLSRSWL